MQVVELCMKEFGCLAHIVVDDKGSGDGWFTDSGLERFLSGVSGQKCKLNV